MVGEPHLLDIELATAGIPHARYAALRRSTPVCWQEAPAAGGYWAILMHAYVQHVSKTPRLFSAEAKGMQLVDSHFCLGAALGRLEARVFLEEFFRCFEGIALAGEPVRLRSMDLHAWKRMPVQLRPRARSAA